ncbi:trafficking kinesin-binding protein 2 isoform X1 [Syngnathus typhle]|uniref:trafficking kinesin-binding protein 2 isoform X1 n=2 Tax=Syngnathus typhle TaxID=161592 RepID=UPI002A6AECAA|nr:trafficking kinesin-binding protein 2 isoform X1 [Syngnathus typhle]
MTSCYAPSQFNVACSAPPRLPLLVFGISCRERRSWQSLGTRHSSCGRIISTKDNGVRPSSITLGSGCDVTSRHPPLPNMFEVKPRAVAKKESSTETDEGLGSSSRNQGSSSVGSCSVESGSFYLSDSQDWVLSPSCSPDDGPAQHTAISPMLAEETFRYMAYLSLDRPSHSQPASHNFSQVLSSDRAEQMTKTYNDIEVVTHLLAERDRDLELAARIGQSLLQRNHLLQERNEAVEEQLAQTLDQVHQLQHELGKKDELLRMVANASEECEADSSVSTPPKQPQLAGGNAAAALSQLESMQCKLQELEEENLALRSEACQLKRDTITYEEKEQRLVSDCVKELRQSNSQMVSMTDELSQKNEELVRHQEEIAQLLSQIVELQHRVKELALEKEELRIHLQASKEAQRQLTAELNELAERNAECVEMFHESQEEIRELRNKNTPPSGMRRHLSYGLYPMDSLAAEIEGTMRRELCVEEESACQDQRISQKRVFQTVRSINASTSRPHSATPPIPGSGRNSLVMTAQPFPSSQGDEVPTGQPGYPGGNDLTKALHRLSLRRQNFLLEHQFFKAERERKLQGLAGAEAHDAGSGCSSPMGSVFSSFSNLSDISIGSSIFRTFLPEKLQIVKPMEGSLTLHHWQQLAKPHLATILDPHPGVVTKGFRPLAQDAVYRLNDMEEDEAGEAHRDEEAGVMEKGATERGKEEDEEEGGIVFKVRCSSTPEEKKERKLSNPPLPAAPLSPSRPPSATGVAETSYTSSQSAPNVSTTTVQSSTPVSVRNPVKCQSSTFSTYTFTTCRILHPCDVTQVTASSQSSVNGNTPSSMRTGPSTPLTPCRLSLGDFFPTRRPPVAASGLAKLVLEKGISAQVSTENPPSCARSTPPKPLLRLLPGTPPNSPSHSPGSECHQRSADNFLASRPAELFLRDVYGLNLGRSPHPDLPSPSRENSARGPSPLNVSLLERLRQMGFSKVPQASATFVSAGGGSLLDGLRRNQSLPAMIGPRVGKPTGQPLPPPHPTSLALPPPAWGNLKQRCTKVTSNTPPHSGES